MKGPLIKSDLPFTRCAGRKCLVTFFLLNSTGLTCLVRPSLHDMIKDPCHAVPPVGSGATGKSVDLAD
jgi:hypothetical protein